MCPGQFTTDLCPSTTFEGSPIYLPNQSCDTNETQERIKTYWEPYHQKLISLIKEMNKPLVLLDAHSIRSQVPLLFSGILPDLNIGTSDGITADKSLTDVVIKACEESPFTHVYNGRFKGGYITRHYGKPADKVQALQLELGQHNYMQENFPYSYDAKKGAQLQLTLHNLLFVIKNWLRQ